MNRSGRKCHEGGGGGEIESALRTASSGPLIVGKIAAAPFDHSMRIRFSVCNLPAYMVHIDATPFFFCFFFGFWSIEGGLTPFQTVAVILQ